VFTVLPPEYERALVVTWPAVALVLAGGLAFLPMYTGSPDARQLLLGGNGLIATLTGIWVRSPRDLGDGG
jgi:hypothetical protein